MSHLQPSLWIAAGYNANDTAEFLTSLLASLNHPNIYLPLRLPGAQKYLDAWGWMAHSVVNQSIDYVMSKGTADFVAALNRTFVSAADRRSLFAEPCMLYEPAVVRHVHWWARCISLPRFSAY